jgi:hypothetical protein
MLVGCFWIDIQSFVIILKICLQTLELVMSYHLIYLTQKTICATRCKSGFFLLVLRKDLGFKFKFPEPNTHKLTLKDAI